jgi:hypothetical protein
MNTIVKKINIGCLVASVLTTASAIYGTTSNSKLVALQLAAEKLTAENIAEARKVNGQRPFSTRKMQAEVSEIMQLASVMRNERKRRMPVLSLPSKQNEGTAGVGFTHVITELPNGLKLRSDPKYWAKAVAEDNSAILAVPKDQMQAFSMQIVSYIEYDIRLEGLTFTPIRLEGGEICTIFHGENDKLTLLSDGTWALLLKGCRPFMNGKVFFVVADPSYQ